MKFHTQTLFGGINSPPAERGDCDRTCLASFLGVEPTDVPHFFGMEDADPHFASHKWLEKRGLARIAFAPKEGEHAYWIPSGPFIAVGKSPRGDWLHAVVARVVAWEPLRWELVHDPHPSREGIEGWPVSWEFIYRLADWNLNQTRAA